MLDRRFDPIGFPDPRLAGPDGLVQTGGVLSARTVLAAEQVGIFPWPVRYRGREILAWWCPDPRAVIEFDGLHVGRTMRRILGQDRYRVTLNQAFLDVVSGCARADGTWETVWITPQLAEVYSDLHRLGSAHSVEVWDADGRLIGGIFGVATGGLFSGESMFGIAPNASKIALIRLVHHLRVRGFDLFDVQLPTDHLIGLGAITIPRATYLDRLAVAVTKRPTLGSALEPWTG